MNIDEFLEEMSKINAQPMATNESATNEGGETVDSKLLPYLNNPQLFKAELLKLEKEQRLSAELMKRQQDGIKRAQHKRGELLIKLKSNELSMAEALTLCAEIVSDLLGDGGVFAKVVREEVNKDESKRQR